MYTDRHIIASKVPLPHPATITVHTNASPRRRQIRWGIIRLQSSASHRLQSGPQAQASTGDNFPLKQTQINTDSSIIEAYNCLFLNTFTGKVILCVHPRPRAAVEMPLHRGHRLPGVLKHGLLLRAAGGHGVHLHPDIPGGQENGPTNESLKLYNHGEGPY